jgi:hypothetical protein
MTLPSCWGAGEDERGYGGIAGEPIPILTFTLAASRSFRKGSGTCREGPEGLAENRMIG